MLKAKDNNINDLEISMNLKQNLNNDEIAVLHSAIMENRVDLIRSLVKDRSIEIISKCLLLSCVLPVTSNIIEVLLQEGADVNVKDENEMTPLHGTCKTQKIDITKMLLQVGADINAQDNSSYTPLHYAIENDDLILVDLLLKSGADTSIVECNGWNALMMALHDHESCVDQILPFTKDLNTTAFNGWTALMHAVTALDKEIVLRLIDCGADVNAHVDGLMPVTLAIERDNVALFDYLWELSDIEVLKSENELENFIESMIYDEWYKPDKLMYFFKVLDTPGIELTCGRYLRMLANSMHEIANNEEFLSVDLLGILNALIEKGVIFSDDDMEAFLTLCYRYHFDYKYKLLNLLVSIEGDFNSAYFMQLTVYNDPEFVTTQLQFCIGIEPIQIFQQIIRVRRLDISMLKLIKYLLRLCTLDKKSRLECVKHIKTFDMVNTDCFCYALILESLNYPLKKYIKYDLTQEEKEYYPILYNEVVELLCKDCIPSLKELCRDRIRKCLQYSKTTKDYLESLDQMHLPIFVRDIIQCKSIVNTL